MWTDLDMNALGKIDINDLLEVDMRKLRYEETEINSLIDK